jgi:hypothetical protein
LQGSVGTKEERNQQPAKPAVPVQEWVDGFELNMRKARFDEKRQLCNILMQEKLSSCISSAKL